MGHDIVLCDVPWHIARGRSRCAVLPGSFRSSGIAVAVGVRLTVEVAGESADSARQRGQPSLAEVTSWSGAGNTIKTEQGGPHACNHLRPWPGFDLDLDHRMRLRRG